MSSHNKEEKLLQIVHNFFLKSANIISQSRSLNGTLSETSTKINKWFNIETQDTLKDDLKLWRNSDSTLPPMVIEVYLDLRELSSKQSLVLNDENHNSWNINTKKSEIVLERWLIELDSDFMDNFDEELPVLYKKLIITFRYLFTITRLLPTHKLLQSLVKSKLTNSPLKIGTRLLDGNRSIISKGRIGLSKPIISTTKDHLIQKLITPVATSMGSLKISVSYRKHYEFQINDNEETLSHIFSHIDSTRHSHTPSFTQTSNTNTTSINPAATIKKVFKSGNISPPSTSPNLTRNESNASIAQALKIQRSGSVGAVVSGQSSSIPKSITSSIGSTHGLPTANELSSSGGTPKYSSSFGKVARRSSLRRSSSVERTLPNVGGSSTSSNPKVEDNLKDFLKLMDSKPDLRLNYKMSVQDSLGKFQMMRSRNDLISESLSASVYSKSTSPPSNPPQSLQIVPSSQQQHTIQKQGESISPSQSPHSRHLSVSPNHYLPLITSRLSEANSSDESLLLGNSSAKIASVPITRIASSSPSSTVSRRMSFSVGPSNPTIAATQTHAKLHKPLNSDTNTKANSNSDNNNNNHNSNSNINNTNTEDDDDDLLFTMSDMNFNCK
ncbi:hypothetical protein WICMUC_005484 [Wickerhamomyces mucosus]|uniref:Autophagy-related protein 13 n=1 Tax=Wickerhamomyces mucosus TaxID=1378264 RepID=A0A9P8P7D5_9ASCO|nr:hypothetical protein WICMUC_005484 [Wickerhamomyces mucosus]